MATPVGEPERPDGYYYGNQHGHQDYQEAIEMQPYPQEPPPDYVPGSGQPAPISTRGQSASSVEWLSGCVVEWLEVVKWFTG